MFGMTPWRDDLVYSWLRLLDDRHSLPFPWTLFLYRRWCPWASHHLVTFLFFYALTVPLLCPFLSLGLTLCRPGCPSASHHSFPCHSFGWLCQRSPRTWPNSLLLRRLRRRKQMPSPLAKCVQAAIPSRRWGTSPQRRWVGPRMATCGVVSPTEAHNNLSPPSSSAQTFFWRAQNSAKPSPSSLCCPCCVPLATHGARGCVL